jgi:hypothetical protein
MLRYRVIEDGFKDKRASPWTLSLHLGLQFDFPTENVKMHTSFYITWGALLPHHAENPGTPHPNGYARLTGLRRKIGVAATKCSMTQTKESCAEQAAGVHFTTADWSLVTV